jgi:hypothetical protein
MLDTLELEPNDLCYQPMHPFPNEAIGSLPLAVMKLSRLEFCQFELEPPSPNNINGVTREGYLPKMIAAAFTSSISLPHRIWHSLLSFNAKRN